MKSLLLAAAAIIAVPAIAQDTPAAPPADSAAQTAPADPAAPAPDPSASPVGDPAAPPSAQGAATAAPTGSGESSVTNAPTMGAPSADADAASKAGGYQPMQTAPATPLAPGQTATFVPPQSPDQAFPAPAPKKSYPICKKGQYDGCRQARSPK